MNLSGSAARDARSTPVVGVVGLGVMGRPIAANLRRAGVATVHLASSAASADLIERGSTPVTSIAELATASTVVITTLPDDDVVRDVVGQLLGPLAPGAVVVDMSTIAPTTARDLHERAAGHGVSFVDAPVSGGERGAVEGTLSIMAGGDRAAFDRVSDTLELLGRRVTYLGPSGAGQVAKSANQVIVGLTIQAVAEAFALADRAGVDPAALREALLGGFADSRILAEHGRRMVEERFDPGARIALHLKDLVIALDLAAASELHLQATGQLATLMAERIAAGDGDLDHAALIRGYRADA